MNTAVTAVGEQGVSKLLEHGVLRYVVPVGRLLFSAIFINAGLSHYSEQVIAYGAAGGVPLAGFLVPFSGVIALIGGLSILLGYRARLGAWLLVLFLVPVTLTLHDFWTIEDPMMAQMDQAIFFKNLSMLGGALIMSQLGAGPVSLDARRRARSSR